MKITELEKKPYRNRVSNGRSREQKIKFAEYVQSWEDNICKPLEKKLNVIVQGFDPSISFYDKNDTAFMNQVQIPLWLAEKILGLRD